MKNTWNSLSAPDFSLIRPWSRALYSEMPFRPPYYAIYESGQKQLFFVAADHIRGHQNSTVALIENLFRKHDPQMAVLEGITSPDTNSANLLYDQIQAAKAKDISNAGENIITAHLALQAGRKFIGGEPSPQALCDHYQCSGYSFTDYSFWRTFLMLKQETVHNNTQFTQHSLADKAAFWSQRYASEYCPERKAEKSFMCWYKEHAGEDLSVESLKNQLWEPSINPEAGYFQRLMATGDSLRDNFSAATTLSALTSNDRVIVVYGSAHEPKQSKLFEQVFRQRPIYKNSI